LPNRGAAQRFVLVGRVGARPDRGHAGAGTAVEGVLELQDLDAELAWRVLVEDPMGGVSVVVAAHSRVVATDDEMRAAVVASHQGVKDRLLRPRVAHPG